MGKWALSKTPYNLSYEELFIEHLNRKLGFKPTPEAGIFTFEDLLDLKRRTELCKRLSKDEQIVYETKTDSKGWLVAQMPERKYRETLSNTKRYRQVPGTSTIYGGRK
jgi:hypothetical protein